MNLFIDTSSNRVTLIRFNELEYQEVIYDAHNDITLTVYEKIKQLFAGVGIKSIENIYVIVGPGSFTGLRVGVTIAKTFAMELGVNIYPINILKLYYLLYGQNIAIDAKGNKYFTYAGNDYLIKAKEEVANNYLIDPTIDVEMLMKKNVLDEFKLENYLDVKVEYLKEVI